MSTLIKEDKIIAQLDMKQALGLDECFISVRRVERHETKIISSL